MKTIAVFLADGFETIEALTPVDFMRRAGLNVITVLVPSTTTTDPLVAVSSHNVKVFADMTLEQYLAQYKNELPDAVFCPGGSTGAVNLSLCKELLEHIKACFDAGRLVTAICASPAVVLSKTGVLKGKKWTCYPGCQEECSADVMSSSTYICDFDTPFITDGNLVTGRGPGTSQRFGMELVRLLAGEDKASQIHKGTLQR